MSEQPQNNRKGAGPLVWTLGGCILLAFLLIGAGAFFVKTFGEQVGKSELAKNQTTMPIARRHLAEIGAALTAYKDAHGGAYPASLEKVVDESLLSYKTSDGNVVRVEYTPPVPDAPGDTGVAGFYVGRMTLNIGRTADTRVYFRLLKNGSVVSEQITRTPDVSF